MRPFARTFVLAVVLSGCGGGAGSGACEQAATTGTRFCHDFHDTSSDTGAAICARLRGTWTAGRTCEGLGYTKSCTDGSFVKPGVACAQ